MSPGVTRRPPASISVVQAGRSPSGPTHTTLPLSIASAPRSMTPKPNSDESHVIRRALRTTRSTHQPYVACSGSCNVARAPLAHLRQESPLRGPIATDRDRGHRHGRCCWSAKQGDTAMDMQTKRMVDGDRTNLHLGRGLGLFSIGLGI